VDEELPMFQRRAMVRGRKMIRSLIQWVAIAIGLLSVPVGIFLMLNGNDDPDVVGRAMATVIILCSIVGFVCHDLEYMGK